MPLYEYQCIDCSTRSEGISYGTWFVSHEVRLDRRAD